MKNKYAHDLEYLCLSIFLSCKLSKYFLQEDSIYMLQYISFGNLYCQRK